MHGSEMAAGGTAALLADEVGVAQDYVVGRCLSMLQLGAARAEWFGEVRRIEAESALFWPRNALLLDFTLARCICAVAEVCAAPHEFDHGRTGSFVDAVARGDCVGAESRWRLHNDHRVDRPSGTLAVYTDALIRALGTYDVAGAADKVVLALPPEYLPMQQVS